MIRFRLDSTPIQHISRYRKHLQTHPLLVLDAHMTFFDIGITAKHIHATLKPTRIVGPIAAYLLYIPGLGQYIRHFAKKYSIVLFPVYRKDELAPKGLVKMFLCSFYPKTLTLRTREEANTAYLKGLETYARQKGTVILVAPYGGVNQIGKKVKYGVRKLMEKRVSMLLSYSCWSVRHAAFATRLVPHTGSMDAAFRTLLSQ